VRPESSDLQRENLRPQYPAPMTSPAAPSWATISNESAEAYGRVLAGEPVDDVSPEALGRLLNLGLLRDGADGPVPVDPSYVSARWRADLLNGVTAIADALRPLAQAYDNRPGREGLIEYLQGSDAINARLSQVMGAASSELLFCQPGGVRKPEILEETNDRDLGALRRGVRTRTLYREEARSGENMGKWVKKMQDAGAEFRTLDEGFPRFFVIDRKVAVIPGNDILTTSSRTDAYMVHDPGVAAFLAGQFERDWNRAEPWTRPEPSGPLTRREIRVLKALEAGASQPAIAKKLDIGERAVAEVIAGLKEHYGVKTLFALGVAWKADGP
jgi:sugar-specific transcriptional regulator TrmB